MHASGKSIGMALLVTMSIIVLITIVVVVFFTHSTSHSKIEFSRVNRIKADLLAQSGLDHATSLLLKEIANTDNSKVTTIAGVSIYIPVDNRSATPRRVVTSTVPLSDPAFANLIRQSVSQANANALQDSSASPDAKASNDSTAAAARDRHSISVARWNAPLLLSGTGFSETTQLPYWIYVTRTGGLSGTASSDVIGRIAYNVYDIGGLFDVNVAGYPSTMSAAQISQLKQTVAGADLTQLGLASSDIDGLVKFRNPAAYKSNAIDPGTYLDLVASFARTGFVSSTASSLTSPSTTYSNMLFANRQDLLRYSRTQNTGLSKALPYLTQFSRSFNVPSWVPANPSGWSATNPNGYDYAAGAENADHCNRNISNIRVVGDDATVVSVTHYRDDGTTEIYNIKAGQPLIQRRFSLSRLAWLTPTGPASGISDQAIQACFGLKWNNSEDRWDYVGPTGSTVQSTIETLAQVANEATAREPNFFELLKAGILSGSVGSGALDSALPIYQTMVADDSSFQGNADIQLMKIGANIIDCADSDSYPTLIALNFGGTAVEVAGTEDLPYLYSLDLITFRTIDASVSPSMLTACDIIAVPEFINPHRTSPSTSTGGPNAVALRVASGQITLVSDNGSSKFIPQIKKFAAPSYTSSSLDIPSLPSVSPGIEIPSDEFDNFRDLPQPRMSGTAANQLANIISYSTDAANATAQVFKLFSYEDPIYVKAGTLPRTTSFPNGTYSIYIQMNALTLDMTYKTPLHGFTKTYSSIGGHDAFPATTGLQGSRQISTFTTSGGFITTPNTGTGNMTSIKNTSPIFPWDPRSQRFGMGSGYFRTPGSLPDSPGGSGDRVRFCLPFFETTSAWKTNFCISGWTRGSKSAPPDASKINSSNNYDDANAKDPDGILRPADGWLDQLDNNVLGGSANPYYQTSSGKLSRASVARPVILNRPFQSVGELGYVFRDAPWKTLSFFDGTSGDSGLLDMFSVKDQPSIMAGRVALNSPHSLVLQSLLSQATLDADGSNPVSPALSGTLAKLYNNFAYSNGLPTAAYPTNIAQLVNFMAAPITPAVDPLKNAGMDTNKYRRESIVRTLADSTQTRTWNVLIDVIAQAGRFPTAAKPTAGNFVVAGESRVWLSIAIDRYTGKIVESQREVVDE